MRALQCAVAEQDAVIGKNPDLVTVESRKAADQRLAVTWLVFVETAAIHQARNNLAHVELHARVLWNDPVKLRRIVGGRLRRNLLDRRLGDAVESGDDVASNGKRMHFGAGKIIAGARDAGVHVRAAQFLDRYFLAGRRLHKRWSGQKNRARSPHDNIIVAECRNIGAPGRTVAHHDRYLRNSHLRQDRLIAKDSAGIVAVGEKFGLKREKAARAVAKMDDRQTVLNRDVESTHNLLNRKGIPGPALHAGVIGVNDDFASGDNADTNHLGGTGHFVVVGLVACKGRQL